MMDQQLHIYLENTFIKSKEDRLRSNIFDILSNDYFSTVQIDGEEYNSISLYIYDMLYMINV